MRRRKLKWINWWTQLVIPFNLDSPANACQTGQARSSWPFLNPRYRRGDVNDSEISLLT